MKPTLLLTLFCCACSTAIVETKTIEDDVETTESTDTVENQSESSDTSESTDLDDTAEPSEEIEDDTPEEEYTSGSGVYTLESDVWFVIGATMLEDSCNWNVPLRDFFGIGSDALLPTDFTVEGYEGYFSIEANDFGAVGPINCSFEEDDFECETQTVTPLDFDLGTYGWTYAIDFTGSALNEQELTGVAEIRFPTISDWLVPVFQSIGVDHTQCVQRFELTIAID